RRGCEVLGREPSRADSREARDAVAAVSLADAADVSRSPERHAHRPDGAPGCHAPGISAHAWRQLSGGRYDRGALRLEEDDWANCGSAGTSSSVEVLVDRRLWPAGVSGLV